MGARRRPGRSSTARPRSAELLRRVQAHAAAAAARSGRPARPAGPARRRRQHHPRRGRACAASATRWPTRTSGSPRASTTTRRPGSGSRSVGGEPIVTVHTAAAEVGQGLVTSSSRSAAPSSACDQVDRAPKDTQVGCGGSTSASRQTYVTGGAVKAACEQVRERGAGARPAAGSAAPCRTCGWTAASVVSGRAASLGRLADLLGGEVIEETVRVAAPADLAGRPGDRAGLRARAVRVRRAPRGGGRGHRARPGQGRGAGLRPGRRQGHQPAGGARPDPGRQRRRAWGWR